MGCILLAGGSEFRGRMEIPDRQAIELAGGPDAPISILPTAAAPDNNHRRAGQNGVNWFKRLGATDITALPLIDDASANDPDIVKALSLSRLIYILGGFPGFLAQTLSESRSWQAILSAHQTGAVIAGSSAGAMVLCEYFYDPQSALPMQGLNLLSGICILPHHNTFGKTWAARLTELLPQIILVGIDEESGVICNITDGFGRVLGKGRMTIYNNGNIGAFGPNHEFDLSLLSIS
jgi:cyanophycinase